MGLEYDSWAYVGLKSNHGPCGVHMSPNPLKWSHTNTDFKKENRTARIKTITWTYYIKSKKILGIKKGFYLLTYRVGEMTPFFF